jgi:aldose sugar dehydrogenase
MDDTRNVRTTSFWMTRCLAALLFTSSGTAVAQAPVPSVVDPNLAVKTVISGLVTPTTLAFLDHDDFLILEKNTGRVLRVTGGEVVATVLDLAVNFASERGLLGMALHPDFPSNPGVYLYWTETLSGADSNTLADVPLLGNRVDRFVWNRDTLTFDRNLIKLRAFQADAGQALRGNHNAGVLKFGPDRKLYIVIGDNGRRGWMQNLQCGPTAECPGLTVVDDPFGGPEPDNAHLTGVILRLHDDGSTPGDNPFFATGAAMGGEVGANIQKLFAYGIRNTFGMTFDPVSGQLWLQENGDDTFSQLRRVDAGLNSGWVQIRGPASRIAEYRAIETTPPLDGLQQIRWPPANLADTPEQALSRLFMLPGAHFRDPEMSWKFEVAPGGIGFHTGQALGPQYRNDLFMGAAAARLEGGHLFHFNLTGSRLKIGVDDPRLEDRVADNTFKTPVAYDITESESLLFGTNFGVSTDIKTGPNGNLFVVSLTRGAVYEIYRLQPKDRPE